MADEQETTNQKKDIQETSTTKSSILKDDIQSKVGGVGGVGISTKNTATTNSNGEVVVKDPMINIGCKQPGGIIIDLPPRAAFKLNYGFNRHNKSIWEKIVASGRYDELIKEGTIYLSKNGC